MGERRARAHPKQRKKHKGGVEAALWTKKQAAAIKAKEASRQWGSRGGAVIRQKGACKRSASRGIAPLPKETEKKSRWRLGGHRAVLVGEAARPRPEPGGFRGRLAGALQRDPRRLLPMLGGRAGEAKNPGPRACGQRPGEAKLITLNVDAKQSAHEVLEQLQKEVARTPLFFFLAGAHLAEQDEAGYAEAWCCGFAAWLQAAEGARAAGGVAVLVSRRRSSAAGPGWAWEVALVCPFCREHISVRVILGELEPSALDGRAPPKYAFVCVAGTRARRPPSARRRAAAPPSRATALRAVARGRATA